MAEANGILSPLSADIHLLGDLLGHVIREQNGDAAYQMVEEVRALAKARRQGDAAAAAALTDLINGVDLTSKRILIKAFSNYFQLINIAEDQQRIRVLRQREANDTLSESIDGAIRTLRRAGMSAGEVRGLLHQLSVRLVLTAHPSEAKRKEILLKLQHVAEMLYRQDHPDLLPREKRQVEAALGEEIEELWQTSPNRATRTTVADEVDFGVYFLTHAIMNVVLDTYDDLRHSLSTYYPDTDWRDLPPLLRYASWVGGDRDGNPNVTADVTLETLKTLRNAARQVYLEEIAFLRDHLTQSSEEVPMEGLLRHSIPESQNALYPHEYYRQKLNLIHEKLAADGYASGNDLLADLDMIDHSLRAHQGQRVADGALGRLMRKIRLFGLNLMPLDVREDARLHAQALQELFQQYQMCADYIALPEAEKQALLLREIGNPRPLFPAEPEFSDVTNRVINTWRMVAKAHKRYGTGVIDSVIASQSTAPSDVLAMLLLATEVGVQDHVDIVPLFESIDDLQHAAAIMAALFQTPVYMEHLKKRGMNQQIMLGYSDSAKDGGYLASNWSLYIAQEGLATLCKQHGVNLELFHGRGGSIGRGGGPTNRAILSQPPDSMTGRIKITEQGEVIAYRYSNPVIARRHLEQIMHAVLLAVGAPQNTDVRPEWRSALDFLSEAGRVAFRQFVYDTSGFIDYWQAATPINELAHLPISSRPAKRKKSGSFADIRAIPWVFSWMQSRAIIPSWFGVGSALQAYLDEQPEGLAVLRTMYREWSFFKALVENVQLDLAKADMGIAALYADLVKDAALRESIFTRMQAEHIRACELIAHILDQGELMANMPVIAVSIERRNPYVDPLNFIQVALLRELRQHEADTPPHAELLSAVLSTINGIAAGMKTTG